MRGYLELVIYLYLHILYLDNSDLFKIIINDFIT